MILKKYKPIHHVHNFFPGAKRIGSNFKTPIVLTRPRRFVRFLCYFPDKNLGIFHRAVAGETFGRIGGWGRRSRSGVWHRPGCCTTAHVYE